LCVRLQDQREQNHWKPDVKFGYFHSKPFRVNSLNIISL
jgi:hypothetical protein